jgi:hypothetical protein
MEPKSSFDNAEPLAPRIPAGPTLNYAGPATEPAPLPIGGWLVLPVIGLFLSPLVIVAQVSKSLLSVYREPTWSLLTKPGSALYDPMWRPLLVFNLSGNVGLVAFDVVLLVMLFSRKRSFPSALIIMLLARLLFIIADHVLTLQIPAVAANESERFMKQVVQSVVICAIWVPYFLISKRVRRTFVK